MKKKRMACNEIMRTAVNKQKREFTSTLEDVLWEELWVM